ncbi:extracellular solute-binding protein [Paenibacillus filicis]|uniref:Extracellular solute-binding protein n=1 Tax=Paenibacillus gyeongsangnamensis TaxID=3388067 RepID=A0ABT4Q4G8_9BACL|nr:extracellular solute-binding protein [Paenibacillus filicis]MCZ8511585.1 extracellular solute-binding protein [Paenibacillus filicis]
MNKKLWKVVIVVCMISMILLSACKNSGNTLTNPAAQTPSATVKPTRPLEKAVQSVLTDKKQVNISFWTGTGATNFPILEEMVKAFQAKYPNITVDFSNQGAIGDLTKKLTQNIVSKSTPTLSNIVASTFPEYISSKAIIDLMPYYEDKTIGLANGNDGIFSYYIDEVKSLGPEGTMYGFPTNKKTSDVLMYNKTYFDSKGWAPPKTWDELVSYAKTIREETGKPGFSFDNAYGDAPFMLLSRQWGSPYIRPDGTIDINNDAGKAALKFYKDNMDRGYFTMPALLPSAGGGKYSNKGFVKDETYMFIGAAAGVQFAIPNPNAGQKNFEVGVAPVPQKDAAKPINFSKGEDYVIFSNATEEQRVAAWLLISFLSDAKNNVKWLTETGNLPISKAMLDEPEYQSFLKAKPSATPGYYRAAAVNAILSAGDLSYIKTVPKSGSLADQVGKMWEAVMIGGGNGDQLLQETASKLK